MQQPIPFRTVGLVNSGRPVAVSRRGQAAFFAASPVGRHWVLHDLATMRPALTSNDAPGTIERLAILDDFVFTACAPAAASPAPARNPPSEQLLAGGVAALPSVAVFERSHVVAVLVVPKDARPTPPLPPLQGFSALLVFGNSLVAAAENVLYVWDWPKAAFVGAIELEKGVHVTALLHPSTYVNKVLVGTGEGHLFLVNIVSG
ncbi:WD repeat-containing protein 36 [Cladochytrium tenue]|nr:WD repeat-containing protein 36 [Cladochytrium tenue]